MIDHVISRLNKKTSYTCQWIRPYTFRCGKCFRGIVKVWPGENRQGTEQDRKACRVCKAKFIVREISR